MAYMNGKNADPTGKTSYVFLERFGKAGGGKGILVSNGFCPTLTSSQLYVVVDDFDMGKYIVRRLMPVEMERLQGFPDGYTDIPWENGKAPISKRMKAIGNSMTTNVMGWIADRIEYALSHPIEEDTSEEIPVQGMLF